MAQHRDQDLQVFQTLYALALSVGLLDLAKAVYSAWTSVNSGASYLHSVWVPALLAVGMVLVVLRMAWAVESLGRFLAARRAGGDASRVRSRIVTLWHYPALLIHAFAVFVLFEIVADTRVDQSLFAFFAVFAGLIVFNAIYLFTVLPSKADGERIDPETDKSYDSGRRPKIGWIVNNITFAIIIAGILLVTKLVGKSPSDSCSLVFLVTAMFANNFVDLYVAADYYVPRC